MEILQIHLNKNNPGRLVWTALVKAIDTSVAHFSQRDWLILRDMAVTCGLETLGEHFMTKPAEVKARSITDAYNKLEADASIKDLSELASWDKHRDLDASIYVLGEQTWFIAITCMSKRALAPYKTHPPLILDNGDYITYATLGAQNVQNLPSGWQTSMGCQVPWNPASHQIKLESEQPCARAPNIDALASLAANQDPGIARLWTLETGPATTALVIHFQCPKNDEKEPAVPESTENAPAKPETVQGLVPDFSKLETKGLKGSHGHFRDDMRDDAGMFAAEVPGGVLVTVSMPSPWGASPVSVCFVPGVKLIKDGKSCRIATA